MNEIAALPGPVAADDYAVRLDTDADYLSLLTRKIFHAGFAMRPVNAKWPAFEEVFHGFEPIQVACMDESDLERLAADPRLVRNRRKLRATVNNARRFCEVAATHGSWRAWLRASRDQPYEVRAEALRQSLDLLGPTATFYFLLEAGEAELDDKPDDVK